MTTDTHQATFQEHVAARLSMGAVEYQGSSYERPPAALLAEVMEELADVGGWSIICRRVLVDARLDADEREAIAEALAHATDTAAAVWSRVGHALSIATAAERAHRAQIEAEHPEAA